MAPPSNNGRSFLSHWAVSQVVTRGDLTLGTSERIILETKPCSSQNYNFYDRINLDGCFGGEVNRLMVRVSNRRGQARGPQRGSPAGVEAHLPSPELSEVEL